MARRHTSDEEEELFVRALRDATPLRARPRATPRPTTNVAPKAAPPKPPPFLDHPAETIGGHRAEHVRRGRIEPEARIDLHGMTRDCAYRTLLAFLNRAHGNGKKVVLVVTGKGGVLRSALPLWLGQSELAPFVSGIAEAHIKHGGSGAFYVSLRRKRRARHVG